MCCYSLSSIDVYYDAHNPKYVNIATDCLADEFAAGKEIRQLRAEYRMQAFLNDVMEPYIVSDGEKRIVSLCNEERKPYAVIEILWS